MDQQLDRFIDLLVEHAMVWVSGTKAAEELGVPHSTLIDWVERLRQQGVQLEGVPGRGFLLKAIPDILTREVIRRAARGTQFGAQIYHYYRVGSTMDQAARLAQRGTSHGTIVLAEEQSAGRGRLGRTWLSERSAGIYCSLVLRPALPASRAPVLTLAAGLALADAVSEITQWPADLRWPNDVLLDSRKCCGILPEMSSEMERVKHIVLGIGLNVNQQEFPEEIAAEATSLALATGRRFARAEVLGAVLHSLDRRYRQLLDAGPAEVIADFERRSSFTRGRSVSVSDERGSFNGVTEGLDPAGFLLVRRADTGDVQPVLSGIVRSL
jgi:BirA family biotin operon repressor/biotin-[acetyl-CoA-carboxylase] ligase